MCSAVVLAAVTAAVAVSERPAAAQSSSSPCAGLVDLVNGGFEDPDSVKTFRIADADDVPGWDTTEPDAKIELWQSGYKDIPAAVGEQFAELSANEQGELYQDRATLPGARLSYAVNHRGREGIDTMEIRIGPPGGPPNLVRQVSTGNTEWQQVLGSYTVPPGQVLTRFGFAAVSNASGNPSIGNFLDGIVFAAARCSMSVTKALAPAGDPGRFDLLVGDDVVAAAAGDGSGSGPVALPLSSVTVSERGAGGTDLAGYASAIRCLDANSRALVAQAPGPELTVGFDRARDVACTVANTPGPAVVLEEALAPEGDGGRFNLRMNGALVARRAGDGAIAGPTRVDTGEVTVSERAAPGTTASAYRSAIQCRDRAGRGDVIVTARETSATFPVRPLGVVYCVLLNVRKGQTPGPPPLPGPPPAPGSAPGVAAASLDLVTRVRPLERGVSAGSDAGFRITVTNRGPLTASGMRIGAFVRQARTPLRARRMALASAVCVTVRGGGACMLPALAPGASATVRLDVQARRGSLAPVRLVGLARPREPERVLRNDVARAAVRILRPGAGCPAAASRASPRARAAC